MKAATGLDSIYPAVPSPPASLCSVLDSYSYKDHPERHYPQRAVGVQPIEDPSIVADRDGYVFLFVSGSRSMGSKSGRTGRLNAGRD